MGTERHPLALSRRRAIRSGMAVAATAIAGCQSRRSASPPIRSPGTPPSSSTTTATPGADPTSDTWFVAPSGSPDNPGTSDRPLGTIQGAVERAQPGQTVHVLAGEYRELVRSVRAGEPGAPVTITGSADAVLRSDPDEYYTVRLNHSHVHLRGLTVTGLEEPGSPDELGAYSRGELVRVHPPLSTDEYLSDVVIAPRAIGYSRKSLVAIERTAGLTIGPVRVIGLAGARYVLTDEVGHNGEIVYLGTAPGNLGSDWHPWTDYDRTHDVRIHHIDNSAGHAHSELVNTKLGTHDVTIEYCTDGGGSRNSETYEPGAVALQSYGATLRWCSLRNGTGHGVTVGSWNARDAQEAISSDALTEAERRGGTDNAIYGNRVTGFDDLAFSFANAPSGQTAAAQRAFCGNTYDGPTDGDPDTVCGPAVPAGDGVGHLGGDSPWV